MTLGRQGLQNLVNLKENVNVRSNRLHIHNILSFYLKRRRRRRRRKQANAMKKRRKNQVHRMFC